MRLPPRLALTASAPAELTARWERRATTHAGSPVWAIGGAGSDEDGSGHDD